MPDGLRRRVYLGRRDTLIESGCRGFDIDDSGRDALFVVARNHQLYGYRNRCPHISGAPMAWKRDAYMAPDGRHIVCFAHGARFLPESGLCVEGPCIGKQLTAVELDIDDTTGHVFALIRTTD